MVSDSPADLCFSCFLGPGSSADQCFSCFWCSAEAIRPSQPSRSVFSIVLVNFGDRQPSRSMLFMFLVLFGDRHPSPHVFGAFWCPAVEPINVFGVFGGQPKQLGRASPADRCFLCCWCFLATGCLADLGFSCLLVPGNSAHQCFCCFWCSAEAIRPSQPTRSVVLVILVFSRPRLEKRTFKSRVFRLRLDQRTYYLIIYDI